MILMVPPRPAGDAVDIGPYEYGGKKRQDTGSDVPTDVTKIETPTTDADVTETETPVQTDVSDNLVLYLPFDEGKGGYHQRSFRISE